MERTATVLENLLDECVHRDLLDHGYVSECDGLAQEPQHIATAGSAQLAIRVVWA